MTTTTLPVKGKGHDQLPEDYQSMLPAGAPGILYAPNQRVPIHRDTLVRFAKFIQEGRAACYVPEIPMLRELGMAQYEPLLYFVPTSMIPRDPASPLKRIYRYVRSMYTDAYELGLIQRAISNPNIERITETTKAEQVHYFVDHFTSIRPKPNQVSVILSNTCNLKCIMCPYHGPEIKATHTTDFFTNRIVMPWETMDRIASECGELRIGVKVGNIEEPLLHPKLLDFIRACRGRGVPTFHITSNGLTLTADKIKELFDAGLTSIYISMDAARPDTYARVRGADLHRVEANVRKLVEIRQQMHAPVSIRTSFVKNRGVSLEEVDEFRERWIKEVDGVIFYNLAEFEEGDSRFVEIHDFVKERMRQAQGRWACLSPFEEIYLLPDGRVYYCCETVSQLAFNNLPTMGSYPKDQILDLWNNHMFHDLRRDLVLNKLDNWKACKDCGIWMAHALQVVDRPDRIIYRNMITEVIDRKKS